jgi:hypothetical protein
VKAGWATRSAACALALAAVAPVTASQPTRLAATLVAGGDAAALVEFPAGQAWLRPGDAMAGCVLLHVQAAAAELECGDRRLRLLLEAGAGMPVEFAPEPAMASIALPPGMLQSLAERPQALALAADFAPVVADGRVRGWTIARLDTSSDLAGLGLQEADVIHAVNGAPAAEPTAFAAALKALPESHAFTVELWRDGVPLTLLVAAPPSSPR